eukprot:11783103-Alexandrium_andersonii.AAC.1
MTPDSALRTAVAAAATAAPLWASLSGKAKVDFVASESIVYKAGQGGLRTAPSVELVPRSARGAA